jgi:hypothetical protein
VAVVHVAMILQRLPGPEWSEFRVTRLQRPTREVLTAARRWPDGTVDRVRMDERTGRATRWNPRGTTTWRTEGPFTAVVAELNDLPAPGGA